MTRVETEAGRRVNVIVPLRLPRYRRATLRKSRVLTVERILTKNFPRG